MNRQPASISAAFGWQPPSAPLAHGDASLSPDIVRQRLDAVARSGRARWAGIDRSNRVLTGQTREALVDRGCWSIWELAGPAAPVRRPRMRWPWAAPM